MNNKVNNLSELESTTITNIDANSNSTSIPQQIVGKLELLEERAVVDKERLDVGKVVVRKDIRTKTVNVPIELVEEVLVIETEYYDADSQELLKGNYDNQEIIRHISPALESVKTVSINGNKVDLGSEPIEIPLSRQVAIVKKETHVVQDIKVKKSVHTHSDTIDIELRHEELDVSEEGYLDHNSIDPK